MIVGVLSDTHGSLHAAVIPLFRAANVELILHAGDVGKRRVLQELEEIAPVVAVRGNIDTNGEVARLPLEARLVKEGTDIYMTHIGGKPLMWLSSLPDPKPDVAICGHSHMALLERASGVLFLNPGAAGTQPRFGQPLSAAILTLADGSASAEIVTL
jgi:putative phosphoesterase